MNNKRKLVIRGVAVLVLFFGVAAFAAFPILGKGAQSNPVKAHIRYSDSQSLAAQARQRHDDSQFLQIAHKQLVGNTTVNSQWVPGQEYIRGQQSRYISPQEYMQRYFSNQFSK